MRRTIKFIFTIFVCVLPVTSFAVTGDFLIPQWYTPSTSQAYQFTDHVVITGDWQLPPHWVANIYVYQDGQIDSVTNQIVTPGTQMTDTNGNPYITESNAGGNATTSGSFSFDLGPQPDGNHNIYIEFIGGDECAVNAKLNSLYGTNYTPVCTITPDNAALIYWPARDYSVALPNYPRMVVTPATNPALNFSNIVFGNQPPFPVYIANTGLQTFTGFIENPQAPFSCAPPNASCAYTVNPNSTTTINIVFAATSTGTFSTTLVFECHGSSGLTPGCDGLPAGTTEYQMRHVIGNSVPNAIPPQISVTTFPNANYGNVNLGVSIPDRYFIVTNTGGGILNGGPINFSSSLEYNCVGSCSYSLWAGQSSPAIYFHYVPSVVGAHDDTASFTGGSGQTVHLFSVVNDKPIVSVDYPNMNFTPVIPLNVGQCKDMTEYIRNSGAGPLSGSITGIYVTSDKTENHPGFSCIDDGTIPSSCNYANILNNGIWTTSVTLRFCPSDALATSTTVVFTNVLNPTNSSVANSAVLSGQGNTSAIGGFSGSNSINFGPVLINTVKYGTTTVRNSGVGILIGSVGALPPGYTCINNPPFSNCSFSLAGGSSTQIAFMFQPTAVQGYNGSVVISGVGNLGLTGSGVQPDFQMSYVGWPESGNCPGVTCLPPSGKTYDVGTTTFGGLSSIQTKDIYLFIENMGAGANLNYSIDTSASPHFICLGTQYPIPSSNCIGSLTPRPTTNASFYYYQQVHLQFQPNAPGDFSEPITINYDYGDGNPHNVVLNLVGHSQSAPYLSVSSPSGSINIWLGNISVGDTATATYTVSNQGVGPMNGNVQPSLVPEFQCVTGCSFIGLLNGDSQDVEITFTPSNAVPYNFYPIFVSNGGTVGFPGIPYPSISGRGVFNPVIAVSPSQLIFPDTNQGLSTRMTVTITNTGAGVLSGSVSPVKAPGLNFYCVTMCSYNLPAGSSTQATIEFAPFLTGGQNSVITFPSNAINAAPNVIVQGIGVFAPIIDIRGGDTDYGKVVVGKSKDRTFTVNNAGTVDLGSGTFIVTGPFVCVDPVDISDGLCHYNLTALSHQDITIRFSPTAIGPAGGSVSLSGVPLARFFVKGEGIPPTLKFQEK